MTALAAMTRTETKLFLREPVIWGAAVILPTVVLVILGAIFGNTPQPELGGQGFLDPVHAFPPRDHARDADRQHVHVPDGRVPREGRAPAAVDDTGSAGDAARRRSSRSTS